MTIVDRFIYSAKPRRVNELVELIKAEQERYPPPRAVRLYLWPIGHPAGQVVGEWEFENEVESDKHWHKWLATPEAATFFEKFFELLTDSGYTRERWELAD